MITPWPEVAEFHGLPLPAPSQLPPPSGPRILSAPELAAAFRPQPARKLSARARYEVALETADACRAALAAEALDGRPVSELAGRLAELAQLEAQVSVADRRNSVAVRLAAIAGRHVR